MKYLKLKLLNVRGVKKMNKELLETGLAALTEAAELVKQAMAAPEIEAKPVGRWKPEIHEKCWWINIAGRVVCMEWGVSEMHKTQYALGNFYRTKEEAQAALDKQLATVRVLDRIAELNAEQGWVADWDDEGQSKYYPLFNYKTNKARFIKFHCDSYLKQLPDAYYGSEQTIQAVIKEMADDCKLMLEAG